MNIIINAYFIEPVYDNFWI